MATPETPMSIFRRVGAGLRHAADVAPNLPGVAADEARRRMLGIAMAQRAVQDAETGAAEDFVGGLSGRPAPAQPTPPPAPPQAPLTPTQVVNGYKQRAAAPPATPPTPPPGIFEAPPIAPGSPGARMAASAPAAPQRTPTEIVRNFGLDPAGRPSPVRPDAFADMTPTERVRAISARMAPPEPEHVPLQFSWGKDVELGANGRPAAPSMIRDPITHQQVQDRSDVGGGGTLSYSGGPGSEAHLNQLRNSGQLDDYMKEQADIKLAETLAADPFAREKASAKAQATAYGSRADATQDAERRSRMMTLGAKADIDADHQATLADNMKKGYTPEQLARANELADQRRDFEYQHAGIPLTADQQLVGRIG